MSTEAKERYLGDGLYASFDGWQIILRAPRSEGDHFIAIDPDVADAMITYMESIGWIIKPNKVADLLEALKVALPLLEAYDSGEWADALTMAREAIDKATGGVK